MKLIFQIFFLLVISTSAFSQAERIHIREGNEHYSIKDYIEAVNSYLEAVYLNDSSFIAHYNLGNGFYKQNNFRSAIHEFKIAANLPTTKFNYSQLHHNLGNAYFKKFFQNDTLIAELSNSINNMRSNKISIDNELLVDSLNKLSANLASEKDSILIASIESYKSALRLNSEDMATKYNLTIAKYIKKQEDQKKKDEENKKDEPKPSEYAKKIKAMADSLIKIHKFYDASEILSKGLKKDKTVKAYQQFINRVDSIVKIEE